MHCRLCLLRLRPSESVPQPLQSLLLPEDAHHIRHARADLSGTNTPLVSHIMSVQRILHEMQERDVGRTF